MERNIRDVFINNLIYYRNKANYSQQELSLKIDCSFNYINSLENKNCTPSLQKIQKIAFALNIKPSLLLEEDGCPKNYLYFNKNEFISSLKQQVEESAGNTLQEKLDSILKNY